MRRWAILLGLLAAVGALPAGEPAAVTLRADYYMPFNGDPRAPQPGSVVEIAREAFAAAGLAVDYQLSPWVRALEDARQGRIDGAIGVDRAVEGLEFPAEPVAWAFSRFITRADQAWTYRGPDSLGELTVGVVAGYDYGDDPEGHSYAAWFAANPGRVQTIKGDRPIELALGMLLRRRIDAFIEDWQVVRHAAQAAKVDLAQLRDAGPAAREGYFMYIGFTPSERGRRLAAALDEGVRRLRADGRLAAILAAYGLEDWRREGRQ